MTVLRQPRPESRAIPKSPREVYYPESDGKPMAESDWHWDETAEITHMLRDRYRNRADVYIASDNFLYYAEGDARKVVSPDVYVVFGVAKRQRPVYKLWEEGAAPAVVFEISSRSTRREDLVQKRDIYARLGVDEYFLCDPLMEYLKPPLQGFRLDPGAGAYRPIEPDSDGRLQSARLGLLLWMEGGLVQLADAATGEQLLRSGEVRERERNAEQMAERERTARQAAEAEVARLRAEIERLRPDSGA